ncbi:carboxypeptidase Y-deficient [Elasticomyces elasticus]|nr:carboxypeptidase Y-deficient [Elasticomyces elasticus]
MASGRSLGGGRILGSGRSLSPAIAVTQHQRNISLLSPSESSLSLSSQASSTPLSTDVEDITSRVALGQKEDGLSTAASASSRLACPICNEEMVTLLQLNRHIDDTHQNLEEIQQKEVKNWFEEQIVKAKKFQPLAVLNQKLKGLEVFEANDAVTPASVASQTSASHGRHASPAPLPAAEQRRDPDEVVTRTHWQRSMVRDVCFDPVCGKRLGSTNGSVNCRSCGRLFCEEHTMYQMKLSRSAQHEPMRGYWCRVCETCYKSREGYNDHNGLERNHYEDFARTRRKTVDKAYLEVSRLEKRLSRLTQLLASVPPEQMQGGLLWGFGGGKSQIRALEQTVVDWEDDASVHVCPFCQQAFSQYAFRRHHCRLCGRVICGDPQTGCSTEVGLNVDTKKGQDQVALDVRMCKDCHHTIFSHADFVRELARNPPDQRAYENLVQFERGIRLLLPRFQRLLVTLQDHVNPPTSAQLADATKVRKRLMDAFTQYDVAARRIRDLPTDSPTQARLQKAIYGQAANFLHLHMLPLKSLPKIMKHAVPANGRPLTPTNRQTSALAAIKYNQLQPGASTDSGPNSSRASSASSAALTALEVEERELRERLIVLEEQKFFVSEMIADANKRRKFDEVSSLASNVEDLSREINQIQSQIAGMDFAGAYAADSMLAPS